MKLGNLPLNVLEQASGLYKFTSRFGKNDCQQHNGNSQQNE